MIRKGKLRLWVALNLKKKKKCKYKRKCYERINRKGQICAKRE